MSPEPHTQPTAEDRRRFLNPAIVTRLSGMDLKARLVVEGFVAGLHKSPHRGFSVEFAEHRPYMPGDPLRHVDWKVYAKTRRVYVKEFEEETNLRGYLLLDASGSMGLGSGEVTKFEYAAHLAAALAYLMIRQRDSVGLLLFDREVRRFLPPRSARGQLHHLLREIEAARTGERTDVAASLQTLSERIHRRGLIILLSDLMDSPEAILRALRQFRHRKHELVVFHIMDPAEFDLPYDEEVVLRDLETGQEMLTQPWRIRSEYARSVADWCDAYRRACHESSIDYVPMNTTTPFDHALFEYLKKRKRLG
jgi:uncharacterized protein (DUF58 family)